MSHARNPSSSSSFSVCSGASVYADSFRDYGLDFTERNCEAMPTPSPQPPRSTPSSLRLGRRRGLSDDHTKQERRKGLFISEEEEQRVFPDLYAQSIDTLSDRTSTLSGLLTPPESHNGDEYDEASEHDDIVNYYFGGRASPSMHPPLSSPLHPTWHNKWIVDEDPKHLQPALRDSYAPSLLSDDTHASSSSNPFAFHEASSSSQSPQGRSSETHAHSHEQDHQHRPGHNPSQKPSRNHHFSMQPTRRHTDLDDPHLELRDRWTTKRDATPTRTSRLMHRESLPSLLPSRSEDQLGYKPPRSVIRFAGGATSKQSEAKKRADPRMLPPLELEETSSASSSPIPIPAAGHSYHYSKASLRSQNSTDIECSHFSPPTPKSIGENPRASLSASAVDKSFLSFPAKGGDRERKRTSRLEFVNKVIASLGTSMQPNNLQARGRKSSLFARKS